MLDHRIVGNLFNVHGHFTNQFFLPFLNLSTLAFILSSQAEFRENRRDREWPSGTGRPGQQFCNLMCSNYVGTLGICKRNSVYLQCAMFSAMNQFYQEMCIHRWSDWLQQRLRDFNWVASKLWNKIQFHMPEFCSPNLHGPLLHLCFHSGQLCSHEKWETVDFVHFLYFTCKLLVSWPLQTSTFSQNQESLVPCCQ